MIEPTCLLTSNLAALKICDFFGFSLPGGTLIFPLLYVLNDILTEVYGFAASRKVIWTALVCNFCLSAALYLVIFLPPSEYWQEQKAFESMFSLSPRILVASFGSYFLGELVNAVVLSLLKIRFKGEFFAARAIFSTLIGSFLESAIFCSIAFLGRMNIEGIVQMVILLTLIKVCYEILVMPITVKIVGFLKIAEKKDAFEKPSLKDIIPGIL